MGLGERRDPALKRVGTPLERCELGKSKAVHSTLMAIPMPAETSKPAKPAKPAKSSKAEPSSGLRGKLPRSALLSDRPATHAKGGLVGESPGRIPDRPEP